MKTDSYLYKELKRANGPTYDFNSFHKLYKTCKDRLDTNTMAVVDKTNGLVIRKLEIIRECVEYSLEQ
jgi:hypothetical protein